MTAGAFTFVADPGTNFSYGQEPAIAARLAALATSLGVNIYGISGYRTPAHSVAVGGFANDPHTQGLAADIGVGSQTRSSAAQISEAELAKFGLYRPFDPTDNPNNSEVNHVQLLPGTGTGATPTSSPTSSPSSPSSSSGSGGVLGSGIGPNVGPDLNPVDAVSGLFSGFLSWLESNLARGALFAVLIVGGISLAVYGLTRTFATRQPQGGVTDA